MQNVVRSTLFGRMLQRCTEITRNKEKAKPGKICQKLKTANAFPSASGPAQITSFASNPGSCSGSVAARQCNRVMRPPHSTMRNPFGNPHPHPGHAAVGRQWGPGVTMPGQVVGAAGHAGDALRRRPAVGFRGLRRRLGRAVPRRAEGHWAEVHVDVHLLRQVRVGVHDELLCGGGGRIGQRRQIISLLSLSTLLLESRVRTK